MFSPSRSVKLFLCQLPVDMRKSFRGLIALTESVLQQDPTSGHLFLFVNRRRERIKALWWDETGFCIWYKRLERGSFQILEADIKATSIELTYAQLALILEGIDLGSVKQRLRYHRPATALNRLSESLSPP